MNLNLHILSLLVILIFFSGLTSQVSMAAESSFNQHTTQKIQKKVFEKKTTKTFTKKVVKKKVAPVSPLLRFDQQYKRFLQRWQIPGSTVAIIKNDKLILSRGYGWADVENHRLMTPDAVFRIASVSKAITAVAILKLVQEGKISLDSTVYNILNDLQPLSKTPPSKRIYNITVRNLLEMSSGWVTDRGIDPMLGPWSINMLQQLHNQIPPDCRTAARMMMTIPMQYQPGTQYSYSNINYCLLGLIINKISGLTGSNGYEAYVTQRLLAPYGITSMRIGNNAPGKQPFNEVRYYFWDSIDNSEANLGRIYDGLPYGRTNLFQKNFSDGGWVASSPDLVKFLQALYKNKILSPRMIQVMSTKPSFQANQNNYFAKGWTIKHIQGHRFILKTGRFTGTQALVMLEDNGTAYAALFNAKPNNLKIFLSQLQSLLVTYSHTQVLSTLPTH